MTSLDLSTANFGETSPGSGLYWGRYDSGTGAIIGDEGYPDFWFPGVTWDRTKKITVTITFDPSNPGDVGGRRAWVQVLEDSDPQASYDTGSYDFGCLYNNSSSAVGNVLTIVILPTRWVSRSVDPAFNTPYFETDGGGAVSSISYVEEDFELPVPPAGDGSVAGSQWSNARTLVAGNGNVFATADIFDTATPSPYNRTFWTFTRTSITRVSFDTWQSTVLDYAEADSFMRLYLCDPADNDLAHATLIATGDDSADGHSGLLSRISQYSPGTLDLAAGTYMLVVGTYSSDDVQWFYNYRVNATLAALVERQTPWSDDLVGNPDNVLVVSPDGGDLQTSDNPNETYRFDQSWYDDLITNMIDGRKGGYYIQEVLGGTFPSSQDAVDCAWAHATNGEYASGGLGFHQYWNTDPDSFESPGPPTCRPTQPPGGPTYELVGNGSGASWGMSCSNPSGFLAGYLQTYVEQSGRAFKFKVALDNLPVYGTLTPPTPEAYGVPSEVIASGAYSLEWESGLKLTQVDVAPDVASRPGAGTVTPENSISFLLNDAIMPSTISEYQWKYGVPGTADQRIDYADGDPVYTTLTAFNDWSDCVASDSDEPDVMVESVMTQALEGAPAAGPDLTGVPDGSWAYGGANSSHLALRLSFDTGRFRYTWYEEGLPEPPIVTTTAMVRQYPGGGLDSAPRLYPTPKTKRLVAGWR